MKRSLRVGILFFTSIFCFGGTAGETYSQGILQEILTRMDRQNKSLSSLKANVTMVKEDVQLGDSTTTNGTVLYLPQRGDDPLVRIDWIRPEESLAVVKKRYIIYRPRLKQAYRGSTEKAKGSASSAGALSFMNMNRAQLKANYDVAYLSEATLSNRTKTWHLRLTPKNKTKYKFAEVWV
ncbi:MAG: hypothetical protein LC730_00320, partial [Acidobacteria bacterium]|nr:hypothetical protein [Acidobacteriota bacterium]